MKFVLLLLLISLNCFAFALERKDVGDIRINGSVLRYSDAVEGGYSAVKIIRDGKVIRALHESDQFQGAFERENAPVISPDGRFIILNQLESGDAVVSDGEVIRHERMRCNIVEIYTGCLIKRAYGEWCAGNFSKEGWVRPFEKVVDLIEIKPTVGDYVRRAKVGSGSDESFENLLACDPPGANNTAVYRSVIENDIFKLSRDQISALENMLN